MLSNVRNILLAGAAGLALIACSGGSTSSPGSSGPVTVNPGGNGGNQTGADLDLVPNNNCPTGTVLETISANGSTIEACTITGNILENTTLTAGIGYALEGAVFVGEDGGANVSLTIPAGTTIFGKSGEDYLVVTRGSRLIANGSVNQPIIMTSAQDVQGLADPVADRGQWGGLVINGFAPINDCIDGTAAGGTAGCEKAGEGSSGLFGGDNPNDNSGSLSYVQVKYAGNLINDEDELNGIAFQGVGRGTNCDHIQVHNNADDGVEFFGGTVQCNYVVITGAGDDSIDWTDGWTGGIQYALVEQAPDAGDRAIEADNREFSNDNLPRSNPSLANFTFIGGAAGDSGMVLRRGTAGDFCNGIITGFQDAGIDLDDQATADQVNNGELTLGSIFLDNPTNLESDGDAGDAAQATAFGADPNNTTGNNSLVAEYFPGPAEQAVAACDLSGWAGFDNVDYIGAFDPTETPDSNWALNWTFGLFEDVVNCPAGTLETGDVVGGKKICSVTGTITSNLRLNNNFVYALEGAVFVGEDAGADPANPIAGAASAILTIDAGTTLFGASETGEDYLVVSRGSQIRSNGTRTAPVVMTSRAEVFGTEDPVNDRGEWGGLVINGRAPINDCIDGTAMGGSVDCEKSGEGSSGLFGGATPDDNSGNLFYTRVSYAGNLINDEDELNGIAFQGVGSGTEVDYVQVHNNVDDGVEFFGGTVNVKHLVLTGIGDDSMDWTDGWTGKAQFVIVEQAPDAGDRAIEADNREFSNDNLPRSAPMLSNFTFVGGASGDSGMVLRRGTAGNFYNGVITGFQDAGIDIDDDATAAQVNANALTFDSLYVVDNAQNLESDGDAGDAAQATAFNGGTNNVDGDAQMPSQDSTLNRFVPGANEQAITGTDTSMVDAFFESAPYAGAVEDAADTWYQGWTVLVTYE